MEFTVSITPFWLERLALAAVCLTIAIYFAKKLCPHTWVKPFDAGRWRVVPADDWRTNISWWQCKRCKKIKNFEFDEQPINFD